MKRSTIILLGILAVLVIYAITLFNGVKRADVAVTQQWGQVEVAYQARADKSKNLVEIVKGAAGYESQTLKDVIEARSKAIQVKLTGDDLTPEKIKQFEEAQANLGGAIGRLLVEQYPQLQAVQAFRDFQAQYEGMENRIATERGRFNTAVAAYNSRIVTFPGNLFAGLFGFKEKTGFTAQPGSENAPDLDLSTK
ncbi:MAG TPA: LemA family protein [Flavobacteriales bacterium]|nr:LemA family protein [Flavobacteriales bacterium]